MLEDGVVHLSKMGFVSDKICFVQLESVFEILLKLTRITNQSADSFFSCSSVAASRECDIHAHLKQNHRLIGNWIIALTAF